MPNFHYKAKKSPHDIETGTVVAASLEDATGQILARGLALLEVTPEHGIKMPVIHAPSFLMRPQRVSLEDVGMFTRQLSDLLEAGVPLLSGFTVIAKQIQNPRMKEIVKAMTVFVKEGGSLSAAVGQHPKVFPAFYVNMVKSGEMSGHLTEVLARLSMFIEKDAQTRSTIKAGLAYPLVVLCVGLLTMFVLMTFVLPKLTGIFDEFDAQLPLLTQVVMWISRFMSYTWIFWVLITIAGVIFVKRLLEMPHYRQMVDKALLKLPILGEFFKQVELARFGRTLGTLLESGVSIVPALEAVSLMADNSELRKDMQAVAQRVKNGQGLTNAMQLSPLFSELVLSMVSVGEESGKLYKGLYKLADTCDRQTENLSKAFVSLLGPAVLILIVMVVGFVILAMLLPIFQMNLIIN